MVMEYQQPLLKYPHSNNSLLSSGNAKKLTAYEPRTEAISPAIIDEIINAEDSNSRTTKDEQTLIVEKLKKVEAEIVQTDLQIVRLRRQKEQLEQAQAAPKHDEDQENVCDTKQLSIAKLVYHENRAKAQKAHAKLECLGPSTDLPIYNQPSDNIIYHHNASKFSLLFKKSLIDCFRSRFQTRLKLEDSVSTEYDRRMEKWLKSIESEDSQPNKRKEDARVRDFFEKQFPELKKARESGERFSRVGQRVARSDAEVAELLDGIVEREDHDKKVKSYAVIPPMLEEMRSKKPKFINTNGYVEDIVAEYKEYQILNTWTDEEKEIFKENYLQHPKNFGLIARMTGRKNVNDCVQYYYLSKKGENYKGLLKRQQRRRTRSLVRPAAATPANNESVTNEVTDNQANDLATNDGSAQNNGSKSSVPMEDVDMNKEACDTDPSDNSNSELEATCCICKCNFSDNNQFRNVTRSNHQLYGISLVTFRPGMKICYPCRFRHVKHPTFDETTLGQKSLDDESFHEQQNNEFTSNDITIMEVDPSVIKTSPDDLRPNQMLTGNTNINSDIPTDALFSSDSCPPNNQPSFEIVDKNGNDNNNIEQQTNSNSNETGTNAAPKQRTYVRDIIYQAIEMSFQKSNEPMETNQEIRRSPVPVCEAQTPNPVAASWPAPNAVPGPPASVVGKTQIKSPPMAHGAKDLRGPGSINDGVLNLSAKSEKVIKTHDAATSVRSPVLKVAPVNINTTTITTTATTITPVATMVPTTAVVAASTVTVATNASPVVANAVAAIVATATTVAAAATPALAPAITSTASSVLSPPTPEQQIAAREDSRSPGEMVIDESAA